MAQARQVILLADSSKAGKASPFASAGRWDGVHVLITNRQFERVFAKELVNRIRSGPEEV